MHLLFVLPISQMLVTSVFYAYTLFAGVFLNKIHYLTFTLLQCLPLLGYQVSSDCPGSNSILTTVVAISYLQPRW